MSEHDDRRDHDEKADEVERELDDLQERSEKLGDEIEGAGADWESRKADESVPGATGEPSEDDGEGDEDGGADDGEKLDFGRVDDVWSWAERSGKATPAAGAQPQPGDLIVWDEHIGVVESVGADGTISTIEGNSSDSVARRSYGADGGGAIGYVRLG